MAGQFPAFHPLVIPVLADHFRQKARSLARQRRRKPGSMPSAESLRVPGLNVLNFLSAGPVTVYRPTSANYRRVAAVAMLRRSFRAPTAPACPESIKLAAGIRAQCQKLETSGRQLCSTGPVPGK
jgi:hypothetical protein